MKLLLIVMLLAEQSGDFQARARAMVNDVFSKDVEAASAKLTPPPPAGLLKQARDQITAQMGALKSIAKVEISAAQGLQIAIVSAVFEKSDLKFAVAFNAAGDMIGFRVVPTTAPAPAWAAAPYADPQKFQERTLTLGAAPWQLPAFLTVPNGPGPFPAIVLVHGSGPVDEDETVGGTKVFKDLAWGLASNGIAVLRYKKRTLVYGAAMARGTYTVMDESVDDARAAIALLAKTPGIDSKRIYVLGHSLGGMLAPRVAANSAAAGIVIMAGSTRPLEDLVVEQTEYLAKAGLAPQSAVEAARQSRADIENPDLTPNMMVQFTGAAIPGSYWLDLRTYNPGTVAAALKIPIMVVRGERDYQVSAADYAGWVKALARHKDATFKLYPGLNHLFVAGSGPSLPTEYAEPGHVDAQVVHDISGWIQSLKR